jgi:hypothetical protein
MLTLTEFLDDNAHRYYPLVGPETATGTDISSLPTDFLVDTHLLFTGDFPKDCLCINKVALSDNHAQIYLAYINSAETLVDLGLLTTIPYSDKLNVEHTVKLINEDYKVIIEGSITIGSFNTILSSGIPVYTLGKNGKIFSQCVTKVTEWCTGLLINGKLYTGLVSLNFDEAEFDIEETFETATDGNKYPVLTIHSAGIRLDNNQITDIVSDQVKDTVNTHLRDVVTSINGCTGAVTIAPGQYSMPERSYTVQDQTINDLNNIEITTQGNSIIISNVLDNPNFDINSLKPAITENINILLDNAEALNERAGVLESHNLTVDNSVTLLGNQIARID